MTEQSKMRVKLLTDGGFFVTEDLVGEVFEAEADADGGFFVKIGETYKKHSSDGMLYFFPSEVEVIENPERCGGATMTEISKVTLEPIKSLETVISEIVQVFNDDCSYGEFFDAYRAIAEAKPEDIAHLLYYRMMETSDKQMIENGHCPGCGGYLVKRVCQDCYNEVYPSELRGVV